MPNTRMISLTNILNKQFETLGVYNLDMSNKISKLTIEIEFNETRDYHIAQYELYQRSPIYITVHKHLKNIFDDYCECEYDIRDYDDIQLSPKQLKLYELFELRVCLLNTSDEDN